MRIRTAMGVIVALFAAVLIGLPSSRSRADDGAVKLFGSPGDVKKMTDADIADLQKILSAGKVAKKDAKRATVLAVVIGLNGQASGNMALNEQAGKVLAALADENTADAKKAAAGLSSASGGGKAVDVVKYLYDNSAKDWDRDLTMQLFKTPRAGGFGIESKIKKWGEEGVKATDLPAVASAAQKCAVIGAAAEKMEPPPNKKNEKADWTKYAKDLQTAATAAINAKDPKSAKTAIDQMDKACTACHEKFK